MSIQIGPNNSESNQSSKANHQNKVTLIPHLTDIFYLITMVTHGYYGYLGGGDLSALLSSCLKPAERGGVRGGERVRGGELCRGGEVGRGMRL